MDKLVPVSVLELVQVMEVASVLELVQVMEVVLEIASVPLLEVVLEIASVPLLELVLEMASVPLLELVLEMASVPSMAYSMEKRTVHPTEWTREVQTGTRMANWTVPWRLPLLASLMVKRTAFLLVERSWMVSWTVPVTDMVIQWVRLGPGWAVLSR